MFGNRSWIIERLHDMTKTAQRAADVAFPPESRTTPTYYHIRPFSAPFWLAALHEHTHTHTHSKSGGRKHGSHGGSSAGVEAASSTHSQLTETVSQFGLMCAHKTHTHIYSHKIVSFCQRIHMCSEKHTHTLTYLCKHHIDRDTLSCARQTNIATTTTRQTRTLI